jgi:hypothetical protein
MWKPNRAFISIKNVTKSSRNSVTVARKSTLAGA